MVHAFGEKNIVAGAWMLLAQVTLVLTGSTQARSEDLHSPYGSQLVAVRCLLLTLLVSCLWRLLGGPAIPNQPNNHEVGCIFGASPETPGRVHSICKEAQDGGARTLPFLAVVQVRLLLTSTALSTLSQLQMLTQLGDPMVAGFGKDYRWLRLHTALIYASACGTATAAAEESQSAQIIDRVVTAL